MSSVSNCNHDNHCFIVCLITKMITICLYDLLISKTMYLRTIFIDPYRANVQISILHNGDNARKYPSFNFHDAYILFETRISPKNNLNLINQYSMWPVSSAG